MPPAEVKKEKDAKAAILGGKKRAPNRLIVDEASQDDNSVVTISSKLRVAPLQTRLVRPT